MPSPLNGRVALVTGVSRRAGIGHAISRRLAALGAPDDPAKLVAFLATDDAAWITGRTISSEDGFRR